MKLQFRWDGRTVAVGTLILAIGRAIPVFGSGDVLNWTMRLVVAAGISIALAGVVEYVRSERVIAEWDTNLIDREFKKMRGQTVRIKQTWIPSPDNFCNTLQDLWIKEGKDRKDFDLEVLLMYPGGEGEGEDDVLGARVVLLDKTRTEARAEIAATATQLAALKDRLEKSRGPEPKLDFGYYKTLPVGPLYQFQDRMYVGFYTSHKGGFRGPMLVVGRSSPLWGIFEGDFKKNWAKRADYDWTAQLGTSTRVLPAEAMAPSKRRARSPSFARRR